MGRCYHDGRRLHGRDCTSPGSVTYFPLLRPRVAMSVSEPTNAQDLGYSVCFRYHATLDETQETCVRTTERVVDSLMPHLTSVKRILRRAVRGNHARACHRTVDQKPQCCSGPDCDTSPLSFWGPMEDVGSVFAVG